MILNQRHIETCTREISRWSKAIRLINVLNHNLFPKNFPEPTLIEPGHKPFDLKFTWEAESLKHSAAIRKRVGSFFDLDTKWRMEGVEYFGLRGRIRIGEKTTLYLRLLVATGLR